MPGVWSLTLEKNGIDRIWSVDSNEENTFDTADAVDNILNLSTVTADVSVRIGGRVYWDINEDGEVQIIEWIKDANLTITSENNPDFTEQLSTNVDGIWELYVPVDDTYNITVTKEGYSTEYISMKIQHNS